MDRKSWIIVVLCVISLFVWNYWYTADYSKRLAAAKKAQEEQAAAQSARGETTPAPVEGEQLVTTAPPVEGATAGEPVPAPAASRGPELAPVIENDAVLGLAERPGEQTVTLVTPLADYTLTNLGGGVKTARLHHHVTSDGQDIIMNEFGRVPVGDISLDPASRDLMVFNIVEQTLTRVVFEAQYSADLKLRKIYEIAQDTELQKEVGYLMTYRVEWINTGGNPVEVKPYYVHTGEEEAIYEDDQSMYTTFQWQSNKGQAQRHVDWFKPSSFLWLIQTSGEKSHFSETFESVSWAGVTNQFYCTLITAKQPRGTEVWASRTAESRPSQQGKIIYAIHGAMKMSGANIRPGETVGHDFQIYTGPKEYSRLNSLKDNEVGVLNFGFFSPISVLLLNALNFLNKYLQSYALAIIGITIILKILLWPLQTSSMRSMKRMSDSMKVLQPKLEALKVKYKENPTRLNEETMKLYKEHQINPMGGCLPSLAQFPIFLGFFYMLRTAVELRNSEFLWVADLSRPDTVLTLLGIPINPLPLIMTASMVLYMRLQPSTGNDMQRKIMMLMPVMFLAFCYNFASALALYWTTQNLLSIVQFYMTKDIREGTPATAAATVGGKPAAIEPPPSSVKKKKKRR